MATLAHAARGLLLASALVALSCGKAKDGHHVSLVVQSAAGVKPGTPVEVAGVPVGEVEEVRLEAWTARVLLRVDRTVNLRDGCSVRIDNRGLVGDRVLTILEGGGGPVAERAELKSYELDMNAGMAQTVERVSAVTADLQAVTKVVRTAVEKEGVAGLRPMLCDGTKPSVR
jgi:phospholipid/cholesterol/gamma-HCH transport system substrate-binding protein